MTFGFLRIGRARAASLASRVLLIAAVFLTFVPFSPLLPASGLDASWMLAMNEATARHLRMGDEIVFTFGPYAFVETMMFHPALDTASLVVGAFVALAFSIGLLLMQSRMTWAWVFAWIILLTGLVVWRDESGLALDTAAIGRNSLCFAYDLLLTITCASLYGATDRVSAFVLRARPVLIPLLFAPLALFPLMKATFLPVTLIVVVACAAYLCWRRRFAVAVASVCVVVVGTVWFWVAIGQPIDGLSTYLLHVPDVVANYEEAMQTPGPNAEAMTYLLTAGSIMAALLFADRLARPQRLLVMLVYFVFLFFTFKGSFIRHDIHAVNASSAIFVAALLLPLVARGRVMMLALAASLAFVTFIDVRYLGLDPVRLAASMSKNVALGLSGIRTRLTDPGRLDDDYRARLAAIARTAALPCLDGTTDIYSAGQSALIASNIPWSPRPTIQSYMTYSGSLAALNAGHLLGERAPVNILFALEAIDDRYPSIEDGMSWPALLADYRPVGRAGRHLVLHRSRPDGEPLASPVRIETRRLGEPIAVDDHDGPMFVRLDFKRSLPGRILATLYKPSRLIIHVETRDGRTASYRLPSSMAASGFVLSPLVESVEQFARLYDPTRRDIGSQVVAFRVEPYSRATLWEPTYRVEFTPLPLPRARPHDDLVELADCHAGR